MKKIWNMDYGMNRKSIHPIITISLAPKDDPCFANLSAKLLSSWRLWKTWSSANPARALWTQDKIQGKSFKFGLERFMKALIIIMESPTMMSFWRPYYDDQLNTQPQEISLCRFFCGFSKPPSILNQRISFGVTNQSLAPAILVDKTYFIII